MKRLIPCLALLLLADTALAETAFQFNAPNLRAPDDPVVNGARVSLFHGRNTSVRGFDLGILSLSESSGFSGFSLIAGVHRLTGDMTGGVALNLVNYHGGRDRGVNAAFVNKLNSTEQAFNVSFLNLADAATQVDLGGVNVSERSTAQIGFVNVTDEIKSFQFGFVNVAANGFLPVFPVVNFPKPSGAASRRP